MRKNYSNIVCIKLVHLPYLYIWCTVTLISSYSLFQIFTKYEKHRRLLLDDILASIARLPSSKRSLRSYRLNSEEYIQMLTALVLQLIQCVVVLPERFQSEGTEKSQVEGKENEEESKDKLVHVSGAGLFLLLFFFFFFFSSCRPMACLFQCVSPSFHRSTSVSLPFRHSVTYLPY